MCSLPFAPTKTTFLVTFALCHLGACALALGQAPSSSEAPPTSPPARVEVQLKPASKDWADHAKTIAEILAPLTTAFFAIWILLITKRLERSQWHSQKLIEKRIEVWDKVGPPVNDIFCYCARVGGWKEFTPPDVIQKKREADQRIHLSRPYFSPEFFDRYQEFIHSCFETFQGHGEDAKLKTDVSEHRNVRTWDPKWDLLFHTIPSSDDQLHNHYGALIAQACRDFSPR